MSGESSAASAHARGVITRGVTRVYGEAAAIRWAAAVDFAVAVICRYCRIDARRQRALRAVMMPLLALRRVL